MFISIEVPNEAEFKKVEVITVGGGDTGKPERKIYKQPVVFLFGKYDTKLSSISIESEEPLKAGSYQLDVSKCFSIGRFDRLEFDQYQAQLVNGGK